MSVNPRVFPHHWSLPRIPFRPRACHPISADPPSHPHPLTTSPSAGSQQQSLHTELAILKLALAAAPPAPVPQLYASFLTPDEAHLVLEHAPGGDLWSVLEDRNAGAAEGDPALGLEEAWVCRWMAEAVEAVEWLHLQGYAHR